MIKLEDLYTAAPKREPITAETLVAEPFYAPHEWQSPANDDMFAGRRSGVASSNEIERILALARRSPPEESTALLARVHAKLRKDTPCRCQAIYRLRGQPAQPCITSLRHVQAWALDELAENRGLIGLIGVGHGKTLLDLLAPMVLQGCKNAVLLVPPTLVDQLLGDYEIAGQHWHVPHFVSHHNGGVTRRSVTPNAPTLHVLPYSRLSRAEAALTLKQIAPDFIIADEAHKISRHDTATTARVMRYLEEAPDTAFAAWSGSITSDTIKQYAHLASAALGEGSPLPRDIETIEDWARCLDPSDNPAPPGALLDLCVAGEHVYDGFRRRLTETSGVIHTTTSAIDAELVIEERDVDETPLAVLEALSALRATWTRPDGEELIDAMSVARCAREIAAGFYYRWRFPRGEPVALIEEWLQCRSRWNRELRAILKLRYERMDSELLCRRAAQRAHGDIEAKQGEPVWRAEHWPAWREIAPHVRPETEAVRIDPFLVHNACQWALENRGIVWYENAEFGKWLAEESKLPLHTGGPDAGVRIARETGATSIVASLKSHGTGRNGLQRLYAAQLFAQPPSSPTMWEQSLGRLHRLGQNAPIVRACFYRHTDELRQHIDRAVVKARYVLGTTGAQQKLLDGLGAE